MKSKVAKFFVWFLGVIYVSTTICFGIIQLTEIKDLHQIINRRIAGIQRSIDYIESDINNIESDVSSIGWDIDEIKKDINWIKVWK